MNTKVVKNNLGYIFFGLHTSLLIILTIIFRFSWLKDNWIVVLVSYFSLSIMSEVLQGKTLRVGHGGFYEPGHPARLYFFSFSIFVYLLCFLAFFEHP